MQGAFSFAFSNRSLTLLAPTPTNNSTNSEADIDKKGTPDSPAIAFANNVFPVPGGPIKRTPLGILAPKSFSFLGFLRNFIISFSSSAASGTPATSSNLVFTSSTVKNFALLFPKPKAFEAIFEVLLRIKIKPKIKIKKRKKVAAELAEEKSFLLLFIVKSILFSDAFSIIN